MAISYRQTTKPTNAERLSNSTVARSGAPVKLYNELLAKYHHLSHQYNQLHSYLFEEEVEEETYSKEVADEIYKKVQQHNSLGYELSSLEAKIEVLSQVY